MQHNTVRVERSGRGGLIAACLATALIAAACGSDGDSTEASDVKAARDRFCNTSASYVQALDRYGRLFTEEGATVGDLRVSGKELSDSRAAVEEAAAELQAANEATVASVNAEAASSSSVTGDTAKPLIVEVDDASIARLASSESEFVDALAGVDDSTPVVDASIEVSSAGYQLQVAWLVLLNDVGCFEGQAQSDALTATRDYVSALQADLQSAGFYDGAVDGVYGPITVTAVEALQRQAGLPVTGLLDRASQAALADLLAGQKSAQVSALQGLLTALGYWTEPIDGIWSDDVANALAKLQVGLGLEPTGQMDVATLRAIQETMAAGTAATGSTTSGATTATTATDATTTSATSPATTEPPTTTAPPAPNEIVDVLRGDGRFTTLLSLLDSEGLTPTLSGEGRFTLFAPTDEAFAAVPAADLAAVRSDPATLRQVLLGHLVNGAVLTADYLVAAGRVTTAARTEVAVTNVNNVVTIGGTATVIDRDIDADNGIVHAIGAVLLPSS